MTSSRSLSPRRPTACSALILMLASKAMSAYGDTITVSAGDSIQDALDAVRPGDTIEIESGEYYEDLRSRVDGTADGRITITAAGGSSNRENVVVHGAGNSRIFELNHDYYTIESFTIDGTNEHAEDSNDDDEWYKEAVRDKLLYVKGNREATIRDGGYLSALDGLIVSDMAFKNGGGECIRLRYFVTNAKIYDNDLANCGLYDFVHDVAAGRKNGEGIYIGTSINQWGDDGDDPTDGPDVCLGNHIKNNKIVTKGNEGVEVKEGSVDNVIEDNNVYMQMDDDSGGIASRGDRTIIRNNYIENVEGAGVRLGGAEEDGHQWGVDNEVYGNTMVDCRSYGVKVMAGPQGQICGNDIELPQDVDDDDYKYTGGTHGEDYDPREDCDSTPEPSPTPQTPAPTLLTPSPTSLTPSPTSPTPSPTPSEDTPSPVTPSPSSSDDPETPSPSSPAPTDSTPSPVGPTKRTNSPVTSSSSTSDDPETPSPSSPAPTVNTPSPVDPAIHTPAPDGDDSETDAEYVGCFANHSDSTTVTFSYRDSDDMTNESCIEHCREQGSRYAGTSRGDRCGCAYSSDRIRRHGESSGCLVPCAGDDSEKCGGHGAVSTWRV